MRRATAVAALAIAACVPTHTSYLAIPVETMDGRTEQHAVLAVPFVELERRLDTFDPERLTFFATGREPIPHRNVDLDEDGVDDHALVEFSIRADGSTSITVLCPGEPAPGDGPEPPPTRGVILRFDLSRD